MSRLGLQIIKRFFKKPEKTELPEELVSLVKGAHFHARSFGDEPRVVVFLSGYAPFVYSHKSFINLLGKYFPVLNEGLKKRASNLLASEISIYLKSGHFPNHVIPKKRARKSWINNW